VDKASYHSQNKKEQPTKSWKKENMHERLTTHHTPFQEEMLKKDLIDLVNNVQ
jgi:hypothetical protein